MHVGNSQIIRVRYAHFDLFYAFFFLIRMFDMKNERKIKRYVKRTFLEALKMLAIHI